MQGLGVVLIVLVASAAAIPTMYRDMGLTEAELSAYLQQNGFINPSKRAFGVWKRSCFLNAGLSQGCDMSDYLSAKAQAHKFSSFAGPGRR